jgi:hypothetical protein
MRVVVSQESVNGAGHLSCHDGGRQRVVAADAEPDPEAKEAQRRHHVHVKIRSRRACMVWTYGELVKKFMDPDMQFES